MSKIKVASVCAPMKLSNPKANLATLSRASAEARQAGADLALFPEVFITGYATPEMYDAGYADRDTFCSLAEPVPGPSTEFIEGVSRSLGMFVCAGLLEKAGAKRHITQVMIDPEKGFVGRYRKIQVGAIEAWFAEPGDEFPVFDVRGIPTGILICRDKSHPEIARILALEGAQLLLNPHSSHSCKPAGKMGFTDWSLRICTTRAMENGCYLIVNNNIFDCPVDDDTQSGHTFALDPYGNVIHCDEGPGHEARTAIIEVDTDVVRERREMEGDHFNLWTRTPSAYHRLVDPDTPRPPSAQP